VRAVAKMDCVHCSQWWAVGVGRELDDVASSVEPDVRFSAASETWEEVLAAGGTHGIEMACDLVLGSAVRIAFGVALNT
jgi:hypothetical protein